MARGLRRLLVAGFFFSIAGCVTASLPDQASQDTPVDISKIVVIPEYPTAGTKYVIDRDGQQEVWLVKDGRGTIEFIDPATGQVKFFITPGPCFSFAVLRGPRASTHDFGAVGRPAYHTVPADCRVWDGRTWTQTYAVQMPRLPQPCYYGARRRAVVVGDPGRRLVTSSSSVDITGPGVPGGYAQATYQIVYSEELGFFKELSPGYIGRKAIVLRKLE